MHNPKIELYNTIFKKSIALGYDTYDALPQEAVSYPFVYLGEQFSHDTITKDRALMTTDLVIHVYGKYNNRSLVEEILFCLKKSAYELTTTQHFQWFVADCDEQTLKDDTTNDLLLHGILEIKFNTR